ncbi:filamentous hemagglutinin family protein [Lysobacter sp. K5869]|uniref:filamentous haemagglutinin family protein n=1 Tax=Lysobacter sp. K5869 TaxID=2820808 RepID=UPI001C061B06|nr:filamentous haemagglutinin family protein [Lysobacter sp. K5869]QWP75491.1 filamentous hemagglutinin family protein [Lysobacter sp. K5869]
MTRKPLAGNDSGRPSRLRRLALSAAISLALVGGAAHADPNPFARRSADPAAQAARSVQQQGLQSVQAQQMAQRSLDAFAQAARVRSALDAAQVAARAAAAASAAANQVPDGLVQGGLKVAAGVRFEPGAIAVEDPRLNQSKLWLGAKGPTQNNDAGGNVTVTIEQTQKKAILSWESFNVGRRTTVHFDQRGGNQTGGGNDWIALNRVDDPSGRPSQIFGQIKAEGSVYLLNRNGVIFGGTSQVNTRSLLVSSLNLFSNDIAQSNRVFIGEGVRRAKADVAVLTSELAEFAGGSAARPQASGDIRIEAGAQLKTGSGGFALVAAPNLSNAGSVIAEDGHAQLAAVVGAFSTPASSGNGNELSLRYSGVAPQASAPNAGYGRLDNTGIVASRRGAVTLTGYDLHQDGYVGTTTSVSRPGRISIVAANHARSAGVDRPGDLSGSTGGKLSFGNGSVTAILPDSDGETTTSAPTADKAFQPPSAVLAAAQMRMQENSLLLMPGAKLDLVGMEPLRDGSNKPEVARIQIDRGAQINVAGLADVLRPMSDNFITIERVGENELADSPLLRGGAFYRKKVVLDARERGVTDDGRAWVGSPLFNAAGYADQRPRGIDQLLIDGGTINVSAREFVARGGSVIDVSGGFLHYQGGMVETPRVIGADGRTYRLAGADPSQSYQGFAGQFSLDHQRWNVREYFLSSFGRSDRYYESDYAQGGDGGQLNITLRQDAGSDATRVDTGLVLAGDLRANAESGRDQRARGAPALGGKLSVSVAGSGYGLWTLQAGAVPDVAADFSMQQRLPQGQGGVLSTQALDRAGFGTVELNDRLSRIDVAQDAHLRVDAGGRIALSGARVDVAGTLQADSGEIALSATSENDPALEAGARRGITVRSGGRLLARGQWVNDRDRVADEREGGAHIDGGKISLSVSEYPRLDGAGRDASGSIVLDPGALLDVSGGGRILPNGQLAAKDGVPLGRGGDIALKLYQPRDGGQTLNPFLPASQFDAEPGAGELRFSAQNLRGGGLAGGGTLSLHARDILIGAAAGDALAADARTLRLDAGFFRDGDFGAYDLVARHDARILAGTPLSVSQRNFLPDLDALRELRSGGDLYAGLDASGAGRYGAFGRLDDYHRDAADFFLEAGAATGRTLQNVPGVDAIRDTLTLGRGAQVQVDAGGAVRLGSRGQLTVLGSVVAHGGSIDLSGDTSSNALSPSHSPSQVDYWRADKSVWVGADAVLDVSGVALLNPFETPLPNGGAAPRDGKVLDGGRIRLSNDGGYVVVEQGARLDLSGGRAMFDLPADGGSLGQAPLQPRAVWSDGGELVLAAAGGLFFDGRIQAAGGDAQARGGSVQLLTAQSVRPLDLGGGRAPLATSQIVFYQSGSRLDAAARAGGVIEPGRSQPSGTMHFQADALDGSGIDTVLVGIGEDGLIRGPGVVPVVFDGEVTLSPARALMINARAFQAGGERGAARLRSAYVSLQGLGGDAAVALAEPGQPGAATLSVEAGFIDIGGRVALRNFADASFDSRGDIRFHTPNEYQSATIANEVRRVPGELLTGGDLSFRAAQLYPATGETFIVRALGAKDAGGQRADTSIRIAGNGNAAALPLSAGGQLLLDATQIEQAGTLRAPAGQIVLGAANADDPATRALFNQLALTPTRKVTLAPGSLTSVSLDGRVLPYGKTVDSLQWDGNDVEQRLTAPPLKRISLDGAELALQDGARVDLSGGGDLQAFEWVAGTGGSRDLLSTYAVSYADGGSGTRASLYPDAREVYAIVPGAQSPLAASDPLLSQGAGGGQVGKSVYLSGVPGLADGVYTLLPGRYATLPGAFRVVQRSGGQDALASQNLTAPDGTHRVAGYYVDALSGAREARSQLFDVQSAAVWGQYSQYQLSRANKFFSEQASKAGRFAPQLPRDGGQLVLSAQRALELAARLDVAAADGGAAAQIDLVADAIQIRGRNQAAREGYVQLDAGQLSALGAGSLLIGGVRERGSDGTAISVRARDVLVSNDAASPLQGPEIVLVAKAGDGSQGVRLEDGSVIQARGALAGAGDLQLSVGQNADAASNRPAISGDGALLRVSNAGAATLQRRGLPAFAQSRGLLDIGAGARVDGGAALMLDASGNARVDASAVLAGRDIQASSGRVVFSADPNADYDGFVVGRNTLAQFGQAQRVSLRSYGEMAFYGDIEVDSDRELNLSARRFGGDGGRVRLRAQRLSLGNELGVQGGPAGDAPAGAGALELRGDAVAFTGGDSQFAGFDKVSVDAGKQISAGGRGSVDFGAADLRLQAPLIQAEGGAEQSLRSGGAIVLARVGEAAGDAARPQGGALELRGASVTGSALIRANSGRASLVATQGDVRLDAGSAIDVSALPKAIFDQPVYAPGGRIELRAERGGIALASGAGLDVSAAAGGGDAGELRLLAAQGAIALDGTLKGAAPKGQGGRIELDSGSALDLDALAQRLAQSGIDRSVSVRSRAGNLQLSAGQTLKAREVSLIADGGADALLRDAANGNVRVLGDIDASGSAGGRIELYGRHGVELQGRLLANGSAADKRGGTVRIGTGGRSDGTLNADYGYQNVLSDAAGVIRIGRDALIDVRGGSAGGLSGGKVELRAPLLVGGDVNVVIDSPAAIVGAREVGLEAYAVWSAADAVDPAHPERHFDGIVDPAGWYGADGKLVAGTWRDASGAELAAPQTPEQLATYLKTHYFTPDAANAAHQGFYGYIDGDGVKHEAGTLMRFAQNPGFAFGERFAGIANFRARPGIELQNPDASRDGGAIRVLTNWNLNSGDRNAPDFRYQGAAPVLTLRAAGDLQIAASISDGFYNYNAAGSGAVGTYDGSVGARNQWLQNTPPSMPDSLAFLPEPPQYDPNDESGQYYGQYDELFGMMTRPDSALDGIVGPGTSLMGFIDLLISIAGVGDAGIAEPAPPTGPGDYAGYLERYRGYVLDLANRVANGELPPMTWTPYLPVLGPVPPAADRTPSLQASAERPTPWLEQQLFGGDSSRYRFVAGADFASVAPDRAGSGAADIVFDGHTTLRKNGQSDLLLPNVLRTGTGEIELVAARDVRFADRDAPASVYTAGRPGEGTRADTSRPRVEGAGSPQNLNGALIAVTGAVTPEAAGDLSLRAGRDIVGNRQIRDSDGRRSGVAGTYLVQYWWPWMQTGNTISTDDGRTLSTSINFGAFAQGLLSVGGDIRLDAGRDLIEVSASSPTTWMRDGAGGLRQFGGGDLIANAGRDVLGGDFFVSKGAGALTAGGRIGSSYDLSVPVYIENISTSVSTMTSSVAPILAMQDAQWRASAAGDVDIGRVLNPSYARLSEREVDSQRFGANASFAATSVTGDVQLGSLSLGDALFGYGARDAGRPQSPYNIGSNSLFAQVLPSSVSLIAIAGDVSVRNGGQLFPSATGGLSLLAGGDVLLYSEQYPRLDTLRLLDIDPSWMPSPLQPLSSLPEATAFDFSRVDVFAPGRDQRANLHRDDREPVRIYALGDIVNGLPDQRQSFNTLTLDLPKPATIRAGRDIVDLDLRGQNYRASDATRVLAGRDLYDRPLGRSISGRVSRYGWLELGGPGSFEIQAGRDLGPFTSANEAYAFNQLRAEGGGIRTIGNRDNAGLGYDGADLVVRFGVAPGIDTRAFAARYLDPAGEESAAYRAWLADYVRQQRRDAGSDGGELSPQQAWAEFAQLPEAVQQRLADRVFLDLLERAGRDNKNPASPEFGKYAAGYRAINTLFPSALGYTANRLDGGANGADAPVATGRLDMRGSTLQTQQGGDVRILGPGGELLVGSVAAPPLVTNNRGETVIGPNQQGVLTLDVGDIGIFTDRSVLLAQSRIFTQRGGDLTIWSSNGDINAGKGAKTSSDKPPVRYVCDVDQYCRIDARGLVTGAGIATLQTATGGKAGDAVLVAPRGTIDAGDAGIRIGGNLIVAAQTIANADNIQVDGESLGIPVARNVDTGALSAASSANAGVNSVAEQMAEKRPAMGGRDLPAVISVQVIGFGQCGVNDPRCANAP